MTDYIKHLYIVISIGPTDCEKVPFLDFIEKEYNKHFDYIIIICPTLWWNKTCHTEGWIRHDDNVCIIWLKFKLYQWIEKLPLLRAGSETLFIIVDIIAEETPDQWRQPLLELAISDMHRKHYLWLLTQSY